MATPQHDRREEATGACRECGTPAVAGARFCGGCGTVLAPAAPAATGTRGAAGGAGSQQHHDADDRDQAGTGRPRWVAWAGLAAAAATLALVAWPSPPVSAPDDRHGRDGATPLPAQLVVRWDVPAPGVGGPTGAGRPPARLGDAALAVADVVVDARGEPTAARPPGAVAAGVWAVAGSQGLVVGDVTTGRITAARPWPPTLAVTPVGPVLAWVGEGDAGRPGDPVLAVAGGGAVRLGADDLGVRWRTEVVPVVDPTDTTGDGGVLVPARSPGSATPRSVLDLRDGRVAVRTSGDLRVLGIGHGLVLTADGGGTVAAWPLPEGPGTLVLPSGDGPRWRLSLASGRAVGVDVLDRGRFAVLAVDIVVGEARLVDASDGGVLAVVAAFPNTDLDGGRTAEAFDGVVVGVVDDELRRFSWDARRLSAVPLGREGWFVARGDGLVQLVARRTGQVRLVAADGDEVPVAVPPPRPDGPDRVVAVVGSAVGIAGIGGVSWIDARTGGRDIAPPPVTPLPRVDGRPLGIDVPATALAVARAAGDTVVVVEAGSVALLSRRDGAERWRAPLPARPALASRTPGAHPGVVVTSRHVVLPLADGSVVALGRDGGELAWSVRVGVPSAVVAAGEEVLVATVGGALVRLGPDGEVAEVAALDGVVGELAVVGDVLLALLPDRLVGIGPPGGPIPDEDRVELSLVRPAQPSRH